ncbi:MAG: hypothetical protein HY659_12445 [Rhizobiales bacterium]|nr:hypothetical protein [Hyphomicrobiales bacterium]
MDDEAILLRAETNAVAASQRWLARAVQARRIAATLPAKDAAIIEVYARDCEAEACRAFERAPVQPIAA